MQSRVITASGVTTDGAALKKQKSRQPNKRRPAQFSGTPGTEFVDFLVEFFARPPTGPTLSATFERIRNAIKVGLHQARPGLHD